MNVYDVYDEQGRGHAFEIENIAISRWGVVKILKTIPGLVVRRSPAWWRYVDDDFCEFELAGTIFKASEPFGDNSRFWFGPSSTRYSEHIATVKDAFLKHTTPRWIRPVRVLSWNLVMLGLLALAADYVFRLQQAVAKPGAIAFSVGGLALLVALVVARNFPVQSVNNAG
jgi:hypothetical protein